MIASELPKEEFHELFRQRDYKELKRILPQYPPKVIANFIASLPKDEMALIFRLLPKDVELEVVGDMEIEEREDLVKSLTAGEVRNLLNEMAPDDRTALFEEMPAGIVKSYINKLSEKEGQDALMILNYPDDSVGRLLTTQFIEIYPYMTVEEALGIVRKRGLKKETVYYLYVISKTRRLEGVASLKSIILSHPKKKIRNIMQEKVVFAHTWTDQEEAVRLIKQYDLLALPVVDSENRLVGIVTIDDVMDVQTEEATEDFHKIAAIIPTEKSYFNIEFWEMIRKRVIWLIVLLFTSWISGKVLSLYSIELSTVIALSFFIPMLLGAGGNTGTQSATLIIRALATQEVKISDFFKILKHEVKIGLALGFLLCLLAITMAYFLDRNFGVSLVVGISIILTLFTANLVGALLPLILKSLKLDPALMAGPFITTIVDIVGLILYFEVAKVILL